jgi:hypothetical protein
VKKSRRTQDITIALVASVMLFLQGVVTAWSAGIMPLGPMLDAFGNPLCITSTDRSPPSENHSSLPDCCTMGCASASPLVALPASDGHGAIPFFVTVFEPGVSEGPAVSGLAHHQGQPRAPPLKS